MLIVCHVIFVLNADVMHEIMLHLVQLFLGGCCCTNAHLLIELSAVGGEDDGVQGLGHFDGKSGLA